MTQNNKTLISCIALLLVMLVVSNYSFAQSADTRITHLQIKRLNDSFIDAYIENADTGKKKPLLIFCQGSGYDSITKGFLGLADLFKDKVAALAIEKQGVRLDDAGDSLSPEYVQYNAVFNRLYDYLRVLEYLRGHAGWWNGDVYIIGGSEGGLIAGMLASFYPNVKGCCHTFFWRRFKFWRSLANCFWPATKSRWKR